MSLSNHWNYGPRYEACRKCGCVRPSAALVGGECSDWPSCATESQDIGYWAAGEWAVIAVTDELLGSRSGKRQQNGRRGGSAKKTRHKAGQGH